MSKQKSKSDFKTKSMDVRNVGQGVLVVEILASAAEMVL